MLKLKLTCQYSDYLKKYVNLLLYILITVNIICTYYLLPNNKLIYIYSQTYFFLIIINQSKKLFQAYEFLHIHSK